MKNYKAIHFFNLLTVLTLIWLMLIPAITLAADDILSQMQGALTGVNLPSGGTDPDATTQAIVGKAIGSLLSVFGILFLGLMIYGGYKWMMASGREEELTKAKAVLKAAITGLIVVMASYAISFFIISSLQGAVK